jgi:hypothetical protein
MAWIVYLLKVSVCMVPFYLLFVLYLRKLTFFSWNRTYLLLSLACSWIIPLLRFQLPQKVPTAVWQWTTATTGEQIPALPEYKLLTTSADTSIASWHSWPTIVMVIYFTGAFWLLLRLIIHVWRIIHLTKKHSAIQEGGWRIVDMEGKYTNSSFFHTIFINRKNLSPEEQNQVLAHEKCHIRCRHSWDILLLESIKIVLWFNPLIYLYQSSLQLIHEFEADTLAASQVDKQGYAQLLLKLSSTTVQPLFIQSFSQHPLSKRIHMLFHSKSASIQKLSYLLGLPVLLAVLFLFSCTTDRDKELIAQDVTTHRALLLIDGKEQPYTSLSQVELQHIRSVELLDQTMATQKYGIKGNNGAITYQSKTNEEATDKFSITFPLPDKRLITIVLTNRNESEKVYHVTTSDKTWREYIEFSKGGTIQINGDVYDVEQIFNLHPQFVSNVLKISANSQLDREKRIEIRSKGSLSAHWPD